MSGLVKSLTFVALLSSPLVSASTCDASQPDSCVKFDDETNEKDEQKDFDSALSFEDCFGSHCGRTSGALELLQNKAEAVKQKADLTIKKDNLDSLFKIVNEDGPQFGTCDTSSIPTCSQLMYWFSASGCSPGTAATLKEQLIQAVCCKASLAQTKASESALDRWNPGCVATCPTSQVQRNKPDRCKIASQWFSSGGCASTCDAETKVALNKEIGCTSSPTFPPQTAGCSAFVNKLLTHDVSLVLVPWSSESALDRYNPNCIATCPTAEVQLNKPDRCNTLSQWFNSGGCGSTCDAETKAVYKIATHCKDAEADYGQLVNDAKAGCC